MRTFFWALAGLLLGSACHSNRISSPKLVGGRVVKSSTSFPSVLIWTGHTAKLRESYCTGTKISDFKILTAAHCVLEQSPLAGKVYTGPWKVLSSISPGQKIRYSFETDLGVSAAKEGELTIKELHLPPMVSACIKDPSLSLADCQNRAPHPDIAIIELVRHSSSEFRVRPASGIDYSFVNSGRRIIIVGFGSEGQNSTIRPRLKFKYTKAASSKKLNSALKSTFATIDGFPDETFFFSSTRSITNKRAANLGNGDSGGPVFDSNTKKVIGVNSDAFCPLNNRDCQLTNNSIFARINKGASSKVGEWLQQNSL